MRFRLEEPLLGSRCGLNNHRPNTCAREFFGRFHVIDHRNRVAEMIDWDTCMLRTQLVHRIGNGVFEFENRI